jgi:phage gp29-like protein
MQEKKSTQDTSTILDASGRPFKLDKAKSLQTDDVRLMGLKRTYSQHPSSGLTPASAASILQAAEQGDLIAQCELAEDIEEKDGHLYAELDKRKRALIGVDYHLVPPRNPSTQEKADTEYLQEMLEEGNWIKTLIKSISDAILKGFSMHELAWTRELGEWFVEVPEYRDPSWFMTHPERRNELRLRDTTDEGAELWPFGWIKHLHLAKSGYISRGGLVRQLIWPFIFKNYSVRDLAEFLEIYGLPLRIGQYPAGANDDEKRALLQAVMSIGHNAGGIMPKGMVMDFHSAATGQADPFDLMMTWAEKTMSKVILGGTLTSQADGKSSTNALGNVHNEVRQELRDSDLAQIAETLTRDLVAPLYALNCKSYQSHRRHPRLVFDTTESEDLRALAYPLRAFVSMGMQIPQQWLHEKTRIPKPANGEAVLAIQEEQPGQSVETALAALAAKDAAKSAVETRAEARAEVIATQTDAIAARDNTDKLIDQLATNAAPLMAQLMSPVADAVLSATSLVELRQQIQGLETELDSKALEKQMQLAIAAAYLLGQVELEEGD